MLVRAWRACQWYHRHHGLASRHAQMHACRPGQWSPIGLITSSVFDKLASLISNIYHRLHELAMQWWQGVTVEWLQCWWRFIMAARYLLNNQCIGCPTCMHTKLTAQSRVTNDFKHQGKQGVEHSVLLIFMKMRRIYSQQLDSFRLHPIALQRWFPKQGGVEITPFWVKTEGKI